MQVLHLFLGVVEGHLGCLRPLRVLGRRASTPKVAAAPSASTIAATSTSMIVIPPSLVARFDPLEEARHLSWASPAVRRLAPSEMVSAPGPVGLGMLRVTPT